MLKLAKPYEEKLKKLFMDIALDPKYMFYTSSNYIQEFTCDNSTWDKFQMVSVNDNDVIIGYLKYDISRNESCAYGVQIINFEPFVDNNIIVGKIKLPGLISNSRTKNRNDYMFGTDVIRFLKDVFEKFNFRKLKYSVYVGNPIEKTYDKLTERFGGRIVGINKEDSILMDGKFYDYKMYEILQKNYIRRK